MAALTGTDIITDALEEIGAIAAGETLTTDDQAKGLKVLNRMIDTMNVPRGNIFSDRLDTYTLTPSKQAYTIGVDPAGILTPDFNAPRPMRIERANVLLTSGSSTVREPLALIDAKQWAAKAYLATVSVPHDLYNDNAEPLSTLRFDPTPDQAYQIELYTWQQFAPLALISSNIIIPPGYYEFWLYSLAMRLSAAYGRQPKATTMQLLAEAKAEIRRLNARAPRMNCAGDHTGGGSGLYNWKSGTTE